MRSSHAFDRRHLEDLGFEGFTPFADLRIEEADTVPAARGVYTIVWPSHLPPVFLSRSTAGRFKGRDPSVPVHMLEAKWVIGAQLVYIGKAENLRGRVEQRMRFGAGVATAAWGGRYIWQLRDSDALLLAWRTCQPGTSARELERGLLEAFRQAYGRLPFANLHR